MKTVFFLFVVAVITGIVIIPNAHSQDDGSVKFFTNPAGDDFYYDSQDLEYRPFSSWDKDEVLTVSIKVINRREGAKVREFTQRLQINCDKLMYRRLETHTINNDGSASSETQAGVLVPIPAGSAVNSLPSVCL